MEKSKYEPNIIEDIVGDKIYNVSKSIFIVDLMDGRYSLYKTQKGNFFVTTNKGQEVKIFWDIMSAFNPLDWSNKTVFGKDINPISSNEVIKLLNETNNKHLIHTLFPELEEA